MNIGIFTDTYFPQINGVVTSTCMLQKELERRGHKVYIFTTTDPNYRQKQPRVFRLPSMPFLFLPTHRVAYMYSPKLLMNFKKLKLDIIHTQTEFPIGILGKVVSEFYKLPYVHTYHTMYEDYVHYVANGHIITPKMAQRFSRIFCNRARVVIAPVEKTKESLLKYGVKRPIEIIPTGLDFEPFRRGKYTKQEIDETKTELGLELTDRIIVYVGRVAKEKSIDTIIKCMPKVLEKIHNTKLVIVGNGPLIEEYKKLSEDLGVSSAVLFTGGKPWDEIGKYYQLGDVFTTASTSETQGLTYLEAMAAKVPVVAKKDSSIENIIFDRETGYIFENDDEAADVLVHVLSNKDEADRVADAGYESIQDFSSQKFAERVENLYNSVIKDNKPKQKKFLLRLKKFNK